MAKFKFRRRPPFDIGTLRALIVLLLGAEPDKQRRSLVWTSDFKMTTLGLTVRSASVRINIHGNRYVVQVADIHPELSAVLKQWTIHQESKP